MPSLVAVLLAAAPLLGGVVGRIHGENKAHAGKSSRRQHGAIGGSCAAPNPRESYPGNCRCEAVGIPQFATPRSCSSDDGTRLVPGIQDPAYDPTTVDWASMQKSVEYIASKEPRVCNMAIRAHFHDALSHTVIDGVNYGSDGSLMIDAYEFANPTDAGDAFSMMTRAVVVQLSFYYGASLADILNVVALSCVGSLGAHVDIPTQCAHDGLDLMVGKLDAPYPFSAKLGDVRSSHLPGGFDFASFWLNFFFVDLNGELDEGSKWRFTLDDAIALMGSHGNIQSVGCMQTGEETGSIAAESDSATKCNGEARVFKWDNSYFKDGNSGSCTPRPPASDPKGSERTKAESNAVTECVFAADATAQMRDQMVCQIKEAQEVLDIPPSPPGVGDSVATHQSGNSPIWRHVDWAPDESRAPCCGYVCPLCGANEAAFYCRGPDGDQADPATTYWPYTWNDCDLAFAAQQGSKGYCDADNHSAACTDAAYLGDTNELRSYIDDMKSYYETFASDNTAWQRAYARGHCKMNNYGAVYSDNKAALLPLLRKKTTAGPSPVGKLPALRGCDNRKCKYDLDDVVTPKLCQLCNFTAFSQSGGPVRFPQPGLEPGPGQPDAGPVFGGECPFGRARGTKKSVPASAFANQREEDEGGERDEAAGAYGDE